MKVPLTMVAAILVMSTAAFGPATAAAEQSISLQAQQENFTRPDVAPLPAEGKFQIVSASAWPGEKVRLFFLGAQF